MANTTFSGPIRAGTQRYGDVTVQNTGTTVLQQFATVNFGSMTTGGVTTNLMTLPAGAKITRIYYDVVTAISGGGVTAIGVSLGKVGGTATFLQASVTTGLAVIRVVQATVDAAMVANQTNNIGTTDVTVNGTFTATTGNPTAGSIVVTIEYSQRNADGSTTLSA